jgi:hypothetical protein
LGAHRGGRHKCATDRSTARDQGPNNRNVLCLNICGNALGALLMGWLFQYVGVNPTLIAIGVAAGLAADVLLLRDRQSGKPTPQAQKV